MLDSEIHIQIVFFFFFAQVWGMHRVHRGKYPLDGYERGHDVPVHVVRFNPTNQQSDKNQYGGGEQKVDSEQGRS